MLKHVALWLLEWLMVGYAATVWILLVVLALPLVLLDSCFRRLP